MRDKRRKNYFDVGHGARQGLLNLETNAEGEPHRKAVEHEAGPFTEIAEKAGTEGLGNAIKRGPRKAVA